MDDVVDLEHLEDEIELLGHVGAGSVVEALDGLRGEDHEGSGLFHSRVGI